MAYNSRHTGHITIAPPLTWAEIKKGPGLQDVRLVLDEDVTDTDEGRATRITCAAIAPLTGDRFAGYRILEELQALIDVHGRTHTFAGHIEAVGEDGGRSRYQVDGAKAVQVQPRIVWPDPGAETAQARRLDRIYDLHAQLLEESSCGPRAHRPGLERAISLLAEAWYGTAPTDPYAPLDGA
ncbi:DUF6205 family protein [Actinomadura sp. LOL_016]|uniref:DUF6205 family protein n=1 Tax=unclassified Actinomadura TaxID=2626254 RepID=UPI003A80D8A5